MFLRIKNNSPESTGEHYITDFIVPPSKSHSIRALILAALAEKPSLIKNLLISGDTESAVSVLKMLGVKINIFKHVNGSSSARVIPPAGGIRRFLCERQSVSGGEPFTVNSGNSGSLFYFLGIILSAIPVHFILTGDASISKRPVLPLTEIYDALGIKYEFLTDKKSAPLKVFGRDIAAFAADTVLMLNGDFSQPITGLLISSVFHKRKLSIHLKTAGELPYLKMTVEWLRLCGITLKVSSNFKNFEIPCGQNITEFTKTIPSDWSSAAFPIAAALVSNSKMKLKNMDICDVQGDCGIIHILKKMNAEIYYNKSKKELRVLPSLNKLQGGQFDLSSMPDSLPALSAIACFARSKTMFTNIAICRFKECDRIAAICSELRKFGAEIEEGKDFLIINGSGGKNLHPSKVFSYGDHRIAMMLIAVSAGISKHEDFCIIKDAECINITYPEFIENISKSGLCKVVF